MCFRPPRNCAFSSITLWKCKTGLRTKTFVPYLPASLNEYFRKRAGKTPLLRYVVEKDFVFKIFNHSLQQRNGITNRCYFLSTAETPISTIFIPQPFPSFPSTIHIHNNNHIPNSIDDDNFFKYFDNFDDDDDD